MHCAEPWFQADGTITGNVSRLSSLLGFKNLTPVNLRACQPWKRMIGLRGMAPGGLLWKLVSKALQAGCVSIIKTPMLPEQIRKMLLDGTSTLWTCSRHSGAPVTFISSGRNYERETRRTDLSATIARNMLGSTRGWDFFNKLPDFVTNPEVLVPMLARALTRQHDPLTKSGDAYVFQRPDIPAVHTPSVITNAWSKILRRRQKSAATSEETELNASDDDTGLEGVVEPQMKRIDTFQIPPSTYSTLPVARSGRVDRLDKFAIAQPEPAEHHGPKTEVDEHGVEQHMCLC